MVVEHKEHAYLSCACYLRVNEEKRRIEFALELLKQRAHLRLHGSRKIAVSWVPDRSRSQQ